MRYSDLKVWLELLETMCETYPFLNNACSHFTKTIWFFMARLWTQNMFPYQFCRIFFDQIEILLKLLCGNLEKGVWIIPNKLLNISSISKTWDIIKHVSLNIIILIFLILLEIHIVQFGITYYKHAEIYLIDGKYQIYSKKFETSTWQFRRCPVHFKNVLAI